MDLKDLKQWLETPKTGRVNPVKMQEVMNAYDIIHKIILSEDPDATIEVAEGALQLGSVSVKIVTAAVTVYDTEMFAKATRNASNFQVYPTIDDRVKLDILFEGVIEYTPI